MTAAEGCGQADPGMLNRGCEGECESHPTAAIHTVTHITLYYTQRNEAESHQLLSVVVGKSLVKIETRSALVGYISTETSKGTEQS